MKYYYNPMQYKKEWEDIPKEEIMRLQKTLQTRLRMMKIKKTKEERIQIISKILEDQNYLCEFGKNNNGKWCCNECKYDNTKNNEIKYIKLKWCKLNALYNNDDPNISNLYLLCDRCNNQLQVNQNLLSIREELESKLSHVNELISKKNI